jgi:hypothetical protein
MRLQLTYGTVPAPWTLVRTSDPIKYHFGCYTLCDYRVYRRLVPCQPKRMDRYAVLHILGRPRILTVGLVTCQRLHPFFPAYTTESPLCKAWELARTDRSRQLE